MENLYNRHTVLYKKYNLFSFKTEFSYPSRIYCILLPRTGAIQQFSKAHE